MKENSVTFSVQMKAMDLFRFKMYHVYHSGSGVFGIFLTLLAIILLLVNFDSMQEQSRAIMILIVVWFVLIDPIRFFLHSVNQVKLNKVYRKPLGYRINENGITVFQDETEQTMAFSQLMKLVETGKQFIVYSSRIHAFIFPKEAVGEDCDLLRSLLLDYTKDQNVKIKGFSKER